jgi:hypothetical protein
MNITDEQGSRVCLMNTSETLFITDQPELVKAVILLSLKRAICLELAMPAGCWAKLLLQLASQY